MPINKFDEGDSNVPENSEEEGKYESIRQKNRKRYSSEKEGEEKNKYKFDFTFDERTNFFSGYDETKEVYLNKKNEMDKEKSENIQKFLFSKVPVPRSYRMIGTISYK